MFKPLVAATAIFALAGSSIVYAQQGPGDRDGFGDRGGRAEHHHRRSAEDVAAFTDARIAALKAGLELTPDQAKNWPPFEQALRDLAQLRIDRIKARQAAAGDQGQTTQPGQTPQQQGGAQQGQNPTPFDRMGRRAERMAKVSAALKRVSDAGAPLYQSLTDAQKGRFKMLARMLRPHHQHMQAGNDRGGEGWRRGGWRQGDGYGRDGGGGGYGNHGGRPFHGFGHQRRWSEEDGGPNGGMQGSVGHDDGQDSQL